MGRYLSSSLLFIFLVICLVCFNPTQKTNAAPINLVPNPSVETSNPNNSALPLNWHTGGWGTNTRTFAYLNTGYNSSHSVSIQTSSYTSGAAEWYFDQANILPGDTYNYSEEYQSTSPSEIDVVITMSDGSTKYIYLGSPSESTNWNLFTANFQAPAGAVSASVYHVILGVGTLTTDNFFLGLSSVPTVSVTSPTTNSTVSGSSVQLSANASDLNGIASVQFLIDGNAIGSPVTSSPYIYTFDSTSLYNGTHTVTAIATNSIGSTTTSAPVTFKTSNSSTQNGNIIPNPTLSNLNASGTRPLDWTPSSYGNLTSSFQVLDTGYNSQSSLEEQNSSYTSGAAEWMFAQEPVIQDQQYRFSDYYQSNLHSEIDASFYMSDGSIIYSILGFTSPNTNWSQFNTTFSVPLGAQSVQIYQYIQGVGYVTTDDYSLTPYSPVGFNRPLLTLTFDDGYSDTYTYGLPLLDQYGFKSTQFIITNSLGTTGYMTTEQVRDLATSKNEIASHTVTHDSLIGDSSATLANELGSSQSVLQSIIRGPVTDLAYPYGYYDNSVVSATQGYYTAARGVEDGLNSKDNFNYYDLKVQDIHNTTTTAQVADWINQAISTNTWLILVYHSVDPNTTSGTGDSIYNVTPTQLSSQLAAIQASGITVETMSKALNEITPQL